MQNHQAVVGCLVHDKVRDVMRFGCSHLCSSKLESVLPSGTVTTWQSETFVFSLKKESLEQHPDVSSTCLWESDTFMMELSHIYLI